ncbi:MAG: ATP-binding protein [Alistipes sp.]|nr:ATP-binding protein [Alistipes sp.]
MTEQEYMSEGRKYGIVAVVKNDKVLYYENRGTSEMRLTCPICECEDVYCVEYSHFRFDTFNDASEGREVLQQAKRIAENPLDKESDFTLFYGAKGSGKTHLLHAIWSEMRRLHPKWRVQCITAESFVSEFETAAYIEELDAFHKRYNAYDALLIDDVDQLAGKEAAQTALFRMIDFKFIAEKSLVFTTSTDTPAFCPRLQMRMNVARKYELPLVTVDGSMPAKDGICHCPACGHSYPLFSSTKTK